MVSWDRTWPRVNGDCRFTIRLFLPEFKYCIRVITLEHALLQDEQKNYWKNNTKDLLERFREIRDGLYFDGRALEICLRKKFVSELLDKAEKILREKLLFDHDRKLLRLN